MGGRGGCWGYCRKKGWGAASEALSLQHTYVDMYLGSVCFGSVVCVLCEMFMVFHVTPGNKRNAYYVGCMKADVAERACLLTR